MKRCRKSILGRGSSKEISLWSLRVLRNRKEVHNDLIVKNKGQWDKVRLEM